jgi:glycosyltransferase involved in cell wall biosynthesis
MSTPTPVTVLIPCHDEAPAIDAVVRGCRATFADRPHEILVVDDGSSDGTAAVAEAAGARVLRLSPNRGKGVALGAGVAAAAHPLLVFLDGDGQDDPAQAPALLDLLESGADLAIGSRFLGTLHPGSIHPLNRVANLAFTGLISVLFRQRVTDSQAGFRAVRRDAYRALDVGAREYDVETDMLVRALKAGWRVREVPVDRHPRQGSRTDFRRVRHGLMILWTILKGRVTP